MTINTGLSAEREPENQNPKRWQCGDPCEYQRAPKRDSDGKPLEKVYKWMREYDKGLCDAWRDEIEKLLILAGLFAGTITAFVINSYKWLQEDNSAASTQLLGQISLQLAAMANNSTLGVSLPSSSAFVPSSQSVRINIVWFLSLMMCLSTVIIGILCLQWLREYMRESSLASSDAITVRQMRYEGLFYWKVPDLISFLPIALQISILLFFAGILDLLWSLHPAVAVVTTIAVSFVAATLIFTTVAPVVQSARYFYRPIVHAAMKQCPYKSPYSWLFLRLAMFVDRHSFHISNYSSKGRLTSWDVFDVAWDERRSRIERRKYSYNVKGLAKALDWTIKTLTPAGAQSDIIPEIFHSLHSGLPRLISHKTLQSWATFIDDKDSEAVVALSLNEYDSTECNVQYDLLMTWFLQRHLSIMNCDDLLMELRLRCLNTLLNRRLMAQMFRELLGDYMRAVASSAIEDASISELRFQSTATILDYHRHHGDSILNAIPRHEFIGKVVANYIRCTPVKVDNALICYEIHKRFERLFDDARSSMQRISASTHDRTASLNAQDQVHFYPLIMVALFLGRIDLRKFEEWEKDIINITGKQISVSGQLNSFLQQDLLPELDAQDLLSSYATEIRHQLNVYHGIDPLINRSDTAEAGNELVIEASVT